MSVTNCVKTGCVKLKGPVCTAFPNGIPHKIAYEDAGCPYFSRGIISHGSLMKRRRNRP